MAHRSLSNAAALPVERSGNRTCSEAVAPLIGVEGAELSCSVVVSCRDLLDDDEASRGLAPDLHRVPALINVDLKICPLSRIDFSLCGCDRHQHLLSSPCIQHNHDVQGHVKTAIEKRKTQRNAACQPMRSACVQISEGRLGFRSDATDRERAV
eukprot:1109432-Rhodomonas_salina.2